jgi:hypothetical protein
VADAKKNPVTAKACGAPASRRRGELRRDATETMTRE